MTANGWTPGPWKRMNGPFGAIEGQPQGIWVGPATDNVRAFVMSEPDAALIAAAPEMADELGNLVGYCDNCGGSGYVDQANESSCRWCSPARALLSRIRGEA